jgi:hypothetical protein
MRDREDDTHMTDRARYPDTDEDTGVAPERGSPPAVTADELVSTLIASS